VKPRPGARSLRLAQWNFVKALDFGAVETLDRPNRTREIGRERMPFEQRRALERKEHERRMKAINAELDETRES
jgi:hypothetical protein